MGKGEGGGGKGKLPCGGARWALRFFFHRGIRALPPAPLTFLSLGRQDSVVGRGADICHKALLLLLLLVLLLLLLLHLWKEMPPGRGGCQTAPAGLGGQGKNWP